MNSYPLFTGSSAIIQYFILCVNVSELSLHLSPPPDVQPDRIYRFSVTSNIYFNAGYGGDVQGQNFRVNVADFEDGAVVVVKFIDDEFIFSAASPDVARSIFRREDQQALLGK